MHDARITGHVSTELVGLGRRPRHTNETAGPSGSVCAAEMASPQSPIGGRTRSAHRRGTAAAGRQLDELTPATGAAQGVRPHARLSQGAGGCSSAPLDEPLARHLASSAGALLAIHKTQCGRRLPVRLTA